MLPAFNLSQPPRIPLQLSGDLAYFTAWEYLPQEGWFLRTIVGNRRRVVRLDQIPALAAPARAVWPAPPLLPFEDEDGDRFDIDYTGTLYRIGASTRSLCRTSDVFALAAALAAHRG